MASGEFQSLLWFCGQKFDMLLQENIPQWCTRFLSCAFTFIALSVSIFRAGAKRHPIWISFDVSWIVFPISNSFLFLAGHQCEWLEHRVNWTDTDVRGAVFEGIATF